MPVYVVDKPLGLSSHDVVAKSRKLLNTRRVGHAGTLDPLATGVLVVLSEKATKLSPFLTASEKAYLAWVSFGASTASLDAEGPILESADASGLSVQTIEEAIPAFLEITEQLPPQYSAVKKGGVKGYEAAREGKSLELASRPAAYHTISLLDFASTRQNLPKTFSPHGEVWRPNEVGQAFELPETLGDFPTALFFIAVQAGTYIRAFARDLGQVLGVPAHLSGLVRTKAGKFHLEHANKLERVATVPGQSLAASLPYPLVDLTEEEATRIRQGQRLPVRFEGRVGLVAREELIAVAENINGKMKLLRVWT